MRSPKKNQSFASTFYPTNNNSTSNGITIKNRPQTASLPYSNKPLRKSVIAWNQSSSTWRNSTKRYSFSKEKRFKTTAPNCLDILEPEMPDTKSKKSCSFGKGNKKPISENTLRNARQKPAPNAYDYSNIDEETRSKSKGKSFTNGWKNCDKLHLDVRKDPYSPHFTRENPAAIYSVRETPGRDKNSKTIYPRQKMFTKKMADLFNYIPGPKYNPQDRQIYNMIGLNERNFSFSERIDLSQPANYYPGPKYNKKGFTEKYTKTKKKNLPAHELNNTIW